MQTVSELGPRLRTIAYFVPRGARVGDIGTDHAFLPIALAADGTIESAVGIDVHKGPYLSALQAVQNQGLASRIDIRLGDGLIPLSPGEVDTLVIAGMGGVTMLEILDSKPEVLQEVNTLILQPQGAEGRVRESLSAGGWRLKTEVLAEEAERVYMVMVFTRMEGLGQGELEEKIKRWQELVLKHLDPDNPDPGVYTGLGHLPSTDSTGKANALRITEVIQRYVWEYGPLILEQGGNLLKRLAAEDCGQLGRQLQEISKGKSEKVSSLIREKKVQLIVLKTLAKLIPSTDSNSEIDTDL